jgi:hypothetical protein
MRKLTAMAWRIDEAVARGEIDNTIEGRTTGLIWLAGREQPLRLTLDGDCWRDLAGTRLRFENPSPVPCDDADALEFEQEGVVGDMTASRKTRASRADSEWYGVAANGDQDGGFEWRNTLYLEWFSEINGRVVIESSSFLLQISEHEWQMDEDAEDAQKLANLNAMRDFMAQVIRRRDPAEPGEEPIGEMDEFAWEERLKESDRLTDAYQEVLEKYMEDPDSERKEAFAMGWDGLLDALAEREEAAHRLLGRDDAFLDPEIYGYDDGDGDDSDEDADEGDSEFSDRSGGIPFDEDDSHPLQLRAQEVARRAIDLASDEAGPGSAGYRLLTNLLQVSGKLAGALNGRGSGYEPETGFVLAVLKRCLNWLNESVGACNELLERETDPEQRAALERLRGAAFEIRDGIVLLRRELK